MALNFGLPHGHDLCLSNHEETLATKLPHLTPYANKESHKKGALLLVSLSFSLTIH